MSIQSTTILAVLTVLGGAAPALAQVSAGAARTAAAAAPSLPTERAASRGDTLTLAQVYGVAQVRSPRLAAAAAARA